MAKLQKAAIYCRDSDVLGTFEPEFPHNTVAYQAGSAMSFIIDKGLTFSGLYVDEADSYLSLRALSGDCARRKIDVIIMRDLRVLADDYDSLLQIEEHFPVPFVGAEDLDCTKENLNIETLEYEKEERHHSDDHKQALRESGKEQAQEKQNEGIFVGLTPYGFKRIDDHLAADPEKAPVVKKMFELVLEGDSPAQVRVFLCEAGIKSPSGKEKWNLPAILKILSNENYCGSEHIERIVSRENFDKVQALLVKKKKRKDEQKQDDFPMAVCDVCGKKLIHKTDGDYYLCDRHTGKIPEEKMLEHEPRIRAQDLKELVTQKYNEFLSKIRPIQDHVPIEEMDIDERGAKVIELGEKLLHSEGEDWKTSCEGYEDLWQDWVTGTKTMISNVTHHITRKHLSVLWSWRRPWTVFDPAIVRSSVKSIRLKPGGTVDIIFYGEDAFQEPQEVKKG